MDFNTLISPTDDNKQTHKVEQVVGVLSQKDLLSYLSEMSDAHNTHNGLNGHA